MRSRRIFVTAVYFLVSALLALKVSAGEPGCGEVGAIPPPEVLTIRSQQLMAYTSGDSWEPLRIPNTRVSREWALKFYGVKDMPALVDRLTMGPFLTKIKDGLNAIQKFQLRKHFRDLLEVTEKLTSAEKSVIPLAKSWEKAFEVVFENESSVVIRISGSNDKIDQTINSPEQDVSHTLKLITVQNSIYAYRTSGLVPDSSLSSRKLLYGFTDVVALQAPKSYYLTYSRDHFISILSRLEIWRKNFNHSFENITTRQDTLENDVLSPFLPDFGAILYQRFYPQDSGLGPLALRDVEIRRAFHSRNTDPLGVSPESTPSSIDLKFFAAIIAGEVPDGIPIRAVAITASHRNYYVNRLGFTPVSTFSIPLWNIDRAYELTASKDDLTRPRVRASQPH